MLPAARAATRGVCAYARPEGAPGQRLQQPARLRGRAAGGRPRHGCRGGRDVGAADLGCRAGKRGGTGRRRPRGRPAAVSGGRPAKASSAPCGQQQAQGQGPPCTPGRRRRRPRGRPATACHQRRRGRRGEARRAAATRVRSKRRRRTQRQLTRAPRARCHSPPQGLRLSPPRPPGAAPGKPRGLPARAVPRPAPLMARPAAELRRHRRAAGCEGASRRLGAGATSPARP